MPDPNKFKKKPSNVNMSKYKPKSGSKPKEEPTSMRQYAAMFVRGVSGLTPGGPIGAVAGAVGEGIGQAIEGEFNPASIASSAAIGAVPFGKAASLARSAIKGGAIGASSTAVSQQAREGLHLPTEEEIGSIALGGALGAAGGGIAHKIASSKGIDLSKYKPKKSTEPSVSSKLPEAASQSSSSIKPESTIVLPRDLAGAKPRFNIGNTVYVPEFKSDIDKAFYIVAQKNPSKREMDYIEFLKKHTGMQEREIRMEALRVKGQVKGIITQASKPGKVDIPTIHVLKPKTIERVNEETGEVIEEVIEDAPKLADDATPEIKDPEDIGWFRKGLAEARSLQTTLDLSAPLRQGITNITRKEFWQNLKPMLEAAQSREGFVKHMDEIAARPTYKVMQKAGVEFTDLTKEMTHREENLRGVFVGNLPLIKNSNQAYTVFLNKLRADTFDRMYKDAAMAGADVGNEANIKAIASFVNDTTGRGHLGRWEGSSLLLNDVFFAPKLIASRVRMLARALGVSMSEGAESPVATQLRQEALRSMAGVGGLAMAAIGLSKLNGAKATDDPRSTDFGKLKLGNTRIDYTGGFQQYIRASAQLASGMANVEGDVQGRNRADVATRFLRNKLSPIVSTVWDLLAGENVIGEKVTLEKEALQLVTPLIISDLIEIAREDAAALPIAAPSTFFGASVQSYPGRQPQVTMPEIALDLPSVR